MANQAAETVAESMRFGMGLVPGAAASADPRATLIRSLDDPSAAMIPARGLPDIRASLDVFLSRRSDLKSQREQQIAARTVGKATDGDMAGPMGAPSEPAPLKPSPSIPTAAGMVSHEMQQRIERALETRTPLIERLALHWFNHFTVSASTGFVGMFAGAYDREAIRPHLLGRFEAMLSATALHPAMLFYLDNRSSVGPNSRVGQGKGKRGLNENLAREILELHTLGVDGGYSQDDIIELAKVLTGWTVDIAEEVPQGKDRLGFDETRHEPGSKHILGKTYREDGPGEVRAVFRDLAAHPATARHVTRRLADHFVGIGRGPALRKTLAETYLASGGDLKAVTAALVGHDEAWTSPLLKSRSPFDLVCAVALMLGNAPQPPKIEASLKAMGQPFWRCPAPAGWPEEDDAWVAPDALKTRLDWALEIGGRHSAGRDIRALAEQTFGASLSQATRQAIARADSPRQGLALLIMSPEMQRR
jgi:uncharacterized protein (DUF1800 family)